MDTAAVGAERTLASLNRTSCPAHSPGARHHLLDHVTAISAPAMWLSPRAGNLCCGADGLYVADRRLLSAWEISLDEIALLPLDAVQDSSDGMRITSYAPLADGHSRDPQLTVTRTRTVRTSRAIERIEVANAGDAPFTVTL